MTTLTLERGSATLVFKNVPARVCKECGESYIDEDTTSEIMAKAEQALNDGVQVDIRYFKAA